MASGKQNLRPVESPDKGAPLKQVAEKIRPLPAEVVPSERFLEKMRLRILQMDAGLNSPQAA
jgi:hypothetical protein